MYGAPPLTLEVRGGALLAGIVFNDLMPIVSIPRRIGDLLLPALGYLRFDQPRVHG